jgi:hypothetical protein
MQIMKRVVLGVASVLFAGVAPAAIVITPAAPTSADAVTIRLQNTFGAEAQPVSATISQSGNHFVIQQNVGIACSLPSNPTVASEFVVGPLPAGSYTVTANITFTGSGPGVPCSPPPITQNGAFQVSSATAIPTIGNFTLFLLATVLAGIASLKLRI